jgi:spore coat protein U-like protein
MRALIVMLLLAAAAQPPPGGSCRIRSPGIEFGPYSALDPFPTMYIGRIDVDCRGTTAGVLRVTISSGRSGNPVDRTLSAGTSQLHYNLYVDPAHRLVAGDGTTGTVALVPLLRSFGGRNTFRVYAVIPPRQAVPAGDYADYLTIEVEF